MLVKRFFTELIGKNWLACLEEQLYIYLLHMWRGGTLAIFFKKSGTEFLN